MAREPQRQTRQRSHGIRRRADGEHRHVADVDAGGAVDFQVLVNNGTRIERCVAVGLPRHPQRAAGVVDRPPAERPLLALEATVAPRQHLHVVELVEDAVPRLVQQRHEVGGVLLPAGHGGEPRVEQVVEIGKPFETDVGCVSVVGVRVDAVLVVQAVGETELDVHPRTVRVIGHETCRRVVIPQVPVLVVDVHLDVERVLDVTVGVELPLGIEDNFRMIVRRDVDAWVAYGRDVRLGLTRHRVIRQAEAHQLLDVARQRVEHGGPVDQLRALRRASRDDDLLRVEAPLLARHRVGRLHLVPVVGHTVDSLDEAVQLDEQPGTAEIVSGGQPGLVDEQFGRVEDARRLHEELVRRRAVRQEVWLVQGSGCLKDVEIFLDRAVTEVADQLLGLLAQRRRRVHPLAGELQVLAIQLGPDGGGEEVQFPVLRLRDESRPEDGPAAEHELRLAADVPLRRFRLQEVVRAEVVRHITVRDAADVVDMGRIDERAGVHDKDAFPWVAVGQVVRHGPAADPRADHDVVEVRVRAVVVPNQAGMRFAFLGNQVCIVVLKRHVCSR